MSPTVAVTEPTFRRRRGRAATALALAGLFAALAVPASAQTPGSSSPRLQSDQFRLQELPAWPAYFVADGDQHHDVRYSAAGTVATQYGYGPHANVATYANSEAYVDPLPGSVDLGGRAVSSLGDLDGDGSVEVALSTVGSRSVTVLGSQDESFPELGVVDLEADLGEVTGVAIIAASTPTAVAAAARLVVTTTEGFAAYHWDDGAGAFARSGRTDPAATFPFDRVLDVFHAPDVASYGDHGPREDGATSQFEVLYVDQGDVYAAAPWYREGDDPVTAFGLPTTPTCVTCGASEAGTITPTDVLAGRVVYDHDFADAADGAGTERDEKRRFVLLHLVDDPGTGRVFISAGTTFNEASDSCDTTLDTAQPENVPHLSAAAEAGKYNSVRMACAGVVDVGGTDHLRVVVYAIGGALGTDTVPIPGHGDLGAPQVHLEYTTDWLRDCGIDVVGVLDCGATPSPARLSVSTLLRTTPDGGGPRTTFLEVRSFGFSQPGNTRELTPYARWGTPVAAGEGASGPLHSVRLPHLIDVAEIEVDDPETPVRVEGEPVPIAVLAAPPTVAAANQDGQGVTFERSRGSSTTVGSSSTDTIGATFGVGYEDPLGIAAVSATASFEESLEEGTAESQAITFSDSYSGTMTDDTLVYRSTPRYAFPGTITASQLGIGVGTRAFASVPDQLRTTITSSGLTSLRERYPHLFGPGGRFTDGLEDILTHAVGDPGTYLTYDNDSAALDDYCLGALDPDLVADVPPDIGLNPNPYMDTPAGPQKPDILLSESHLVQAGPANMEGASFAIEQGQEDSRVASTEVSAAVEAQVGGVVAGVNAAQGWSTSVTNTLTEGVSFSANIGNIPSAALGLEEYVWRMFLCTKLLETDRGDSYPIKVLNFTVDGYAGTGGLEPLSDLVNDGPRHSAQVGLRPELTWTQAQGTVESYRWELEAVGVADRRTGEVAFPDPLAANARDRTLRVRPPDDLLADQLYRWRVTGTDFFGNERVSEWEFFVTEAGAGNGGPTGPDVVAPGGTATSTVGSVGVAVTTPQGGRVTVKPAPAGSGSDDGYEVAGTRIAVDAPPGTVDEPLVVRLRFAAGTVDEPGTQVVRRDGVPVRRCSDPSGTSATPDPCLAFLRSTGDGDLLAEIRTSRASVWDLAAIVPGSILPACPAGSTPVTRFDDTAGNVHADAIACAAGNGVARGRTTTTYEPGTAVTRGQMASFVARLLDTAGVELPASPPARFSDVVGVHAEAIDQLAALGIVDGVAADRYAPGRAVTRAQTATMLIGVHHLLTGRSLAFGRPGRFFDLDGGVHDLAILQAAEHGFVLGKADGRFDPGGALQRDQMASVLMRLLAHVVASGDVGLA